MFESFFPKPKLFLLTLLGWTAFVMLIYYTLGQNIAELLGFKFSEDGTPTVIGLGYFVTPEFLWFDLYYISSTLIFLFHLRTKENPSMFPANNLIFLSNIRPLSGAIM